MASINIHSASPISSVSSKEDILEEKTTLDNMTVKSQTAVASSSGLKALNGVSTISTSNLAKTENLITDSASDEVLLAPECPAPVSTPEPVRQVTDESWHWTNTNTLNTGSPSRSVPRIHTRKTSLSANIDLPWKIDNTSSSSTWTGGYSTPTHQRRSSSIAPPPKVGESAVRSNFEAPGSPYVQARDQSPHPSQSPSRFTHTRHSSSSPYSSMSSTSYTRPSTPPHVHSLTHPPGYHQNTQAIQSNTTANGALYTSNNSPLYTSNSPFQFPLNTSSFPTLSHNGASPTRGRGRGILDNDPSIYLGNSEEGTEDDTMWDTATRWAKAAGKRLSTGDIGLWKLVGGEER